MLSEWLKNRLHRARTGEIILGKYLLLSLPSSDQKPSLSPQRDCRAPAAGAEMRRYPHTEHPPPLCVCVLFRAFIPVLLGLFALPSPHSVKHGDASPRGWEKHLFSPALYSSLSLLNKLRPSFPGDATPLTSAIGWKPRRRRRGTEVHAAMMRTEDERRERERDGGRRKWTEDNRQRERKEDREEDEKSGMRQKRRVRV